jgi:hypothetical protein
MVTCEEECHDLDLRHNKFMKADKPFWQFQASVVEFCQDQDLVPH